MKIGRNLILCELLCITLTLALLLNTPPKLADEAPAPASVNAMPTSIRESIVLKAASQLGEHYLWGTQGEVGTVSPYTWESYTCKGPEIGLGPCTEHKHFDCSGFVYWVLTNCGVSIARHTADDYYRMCYNITHAQRAKGDLIFLREPPGYLGAHHVGIYCDDNHIYEARGSNYGVVNRTLNDWLETGEDVLFGSLWAVKLECPDNHHANIKAGNYTTYDIKVINKGAVQDTISLERSEPPSGWTATLSQTSVTLGSHGWRIITLNVTTPPGSMWEGSATISVIAKSSGDGLSKVTRATITTFTFMPGILIYAVPLASAIIVLVLILVWTFKRKRKLPTDLPTTKIT